MAYRFFDQARAEKRGLNWQSILQPHIDCSQRRMAQHPVVLCLQDTAELDFYGQGIDAPAGYPPVERRLLTHRDVVGLAAAVEWIDGYRCRWEIETLFQVLKNGCRVEALQLGSQSTSWSGRWRSIWSFPGALPA